MCEMVIITRVFYWKRLGCTSRCGLLELVRAPDARTACRSGSICLWLGSLAMFSLLPIHGGNLDIAGRECRSSVSHLLVSRRKDASSSIAVFSFPHLRGI